MMDKPMLDAASCQNLSWRKFAGRSKALRQSTLLATRCTL
jgi:hypothetical protein